MIKVSYNGKEYHLNKDKLLYVLSKLKNEDIEESQIQELLIEFQLLDDVFLENINKI